MKVTLRSAEIILDDMDGLVQACCFSFADALEILQFCTKPSISQLRIFYRKQQMQLIWNSFAHWIPENVKYVKMYIKEHSSWYSCVNGYGVLRCELKLKLFLWMDITWLHVNSLYLLCYSRVDSRFAPSQWETALLCNAVSHWLGASLESALLFCVTWML